MSEHRTNPVFTRWVIAAIVFMVIATSVSVLLAIYGSGENRDKEVAQAGQAQQQEDKKDLAEQIKQICDGGNTAAKKELLAKNPSICGQVTQIVKEGPAGPPGDPGVKGDKGDKGDTGAPGQSPACLLQANRCVGPTGATGAIGPMGPAGKNGVDGKDGLNGKDGAVGPAGPAGKDGADGTDGEDGVDGATGPTGPAGPAGTNGTDGRGIKSVTCPDDQDPTTDDPFVVTYTDNTTASVGVCRQRSIP